METTLVCFLFHVTGEYGCRSRVLSISQSVADLTPRKEHLDPAGEHHLSLSCPERHLGASRKIIVIHSPLKITAYKGFFVNYWFAGAGGQQTLWLIRISLNSVVAARWRVAEEDHSEQLGCCSCCHYCYWGCCTLGRHTNDNLPFISKWDYISEII